MSLAYTNPADTSRRTALRKMQPRKSTRIIRRVLIGIAVLFVLVNLLAVANPWFHRNDVRTACARSAT